MPLPLGLTRLYCLFPGAIDGKTTLAAYILERCLTPGDAWHVAWRGVHFRGANVGSSGVVFPSYPASIGAVGRVQFHRQRHAQADRTPGHGYGLAGSGQSNGKGSMGIVGCPVAVLDEAGSWEVNGGQLMHDSIQGALGKPDSPMRAIYIGTVAPATAAGWWPELVKGGSSGSVYVQALVADVEKVG